MIRWLWTLNSSLWNSLLYYPWGLMDGTKYVKKKSNMFFFTSTRDKKWMHALIYIIKTKCAVIKHSTYIEKILWPLGSDFRAGPIWQNSENELNLWKSSSQSHYYLRNTKCIALKPSTFLCEIPSPWVSGSGHMGRANMATVNIIKILRIFFCLFTVVWYKLNALLLCS